MNVFQVITQLAYTFFAKAAVQGELILNEADSVANSVPVDVPQQTSEASISLFDLLIKGGFVMVPIGILSILTIYLFIERLFYIRSKMKTDKNFMSSVKDHIHNGNISGAINHCANTDSAIGNIIGKGVKRIGKPIKEIESSMESIANIELMQMERNLGYLGIIAGIAPMFGFIGTISGIIRIFYNISLSDNISVGIIAGGLYEKMITSGSGLIVGVLAYIAYHYLNSLIDRFTLSAEKTSVEFLDILQDNQ